VSAHNWAIVAMVGALSSCFLALHRDRNALGWLLVGAALPGVSLLLQFIERHRTSWRTVASGACFVLLVTTAIEAIELFRARQRIAVLADDHVRRVDYCTGHRARVQTLRRALDGKTTRAKDFVVREAEHVLAGDVMRLCGIDHAKYARLIDDADWCWIADDDPACYRYAVHALDDDLRR
jgi:hypothetical protein